MAARQAGCYSPGYSGGAGPGPPGVSGPVSRSASERGTLCGDVRSGAVGRRGAPGAAPPGVRSGAGLRGAARPWCLPRRGRCHTPDYRREMPGPFGSHLIKRQGAERGSGCFRFPVYGDADCRSVGCSYSPGRRGRRGGEAGNSASGDAGGGVRCLTGGRGRRVVLPRRTANGARPYGIWPPGHSATLPREGNPPGERETERNVPEKEMRKGMEWRGTHRKAADREGPGKPRPRPLTRAGAASPGRRARSAPPPPPARSRPRSTPGASGATPGGGPCTGRPRGAGADSR